MSAWFYCGDEGGIIAYPWLPPFSLGSKNKSTLYLAFIQARETKALAVALALALAWLENHFSIAVDFMITVFLSPPFVQY